MDQFLGEGSINEKPGAVDYLKGLLRETVREKARELAAVTAASGR